MSPQLLPIPALWSPAVLLQLVAWICLVGGIFKLIGGFHVGYSSGGQKDIYLGLEMIGFYCLFYWILFTIVPWFNHLGGLK